jgi:hypothetical protein
MSPVLPDGPNPNRLRPNGHIRDLGDDHFGPNGGFPSTKKGAALAAPLRRTVD